MAPRGNWTFEIGSFMVLLAEQQETDYRLMQRCLLECLTAAPVAGLQSYLRSFSILTDTQGPEYISPYGCKRAPLRNMRLHQTIGLHDLLKDSRASVHQIKTNIGGKRSEKLKLCTLLWTMTTWILFTCILGFATIYEKMTWIGISSVTSLTFCSIAMRLLEFCCLEVPTHYPSNPNIHDAIIVLGRRNSCFVLEGRRADIARWTGLGLQTKHSIRHQTAQVSVRVISLALILFIFATVPNGSTADQLVFICVNLLGQLNNLVGRLLNSHRYVTRLTNVHEEWMRTRTDVYGFLLRRFGNGAWVDKVGLLPSTPVWEHWRGSVVESKLNPKGLYDGSQISVTATAG